jgi:hypothetical protein
VAVDQLLLDDIAATVAQLYREAESALTRQIADRLANGMDHPYAETKLDAIRKLQRAARTILATLNNRVGPVVRQSIADAYRNGWGSAVEDLPKEWFAKSGIGQDAARARQEVPNTAAIESIATAVVQDIGEKSRNVLRDVVDAFRSVQTAAAARVLTGIQTRRQTSQAAWQRLVDQGITGFTDSAGRRWKLSSYVEMVARTNAQRAAVQAQTDRLGSLGVPLVYISNAPQECRLCRPYEGKILSLDGRAGKRTVAHQLTDKPVTVVVKATLPEAMAAGLFHPNCRHSASAYLPGLTKLPEGPTEDPEGDKARQRQRALEREIRKHKERSAAALTPEGKQAADARVRDWQKELRNHLAAHPDLKRLSYRERIGAGNIPGKGGPNGGAAGGIGPDQQPTLDGGPGSKQPTAKPHQAGPDNGPVKGQQDLLNQKPAKPKSKPKAPKAPPKPEPQGDAKRYHRDLDGIEDLAHDVENGFPPKDRRPLGGGAVADVELITLKDGKKVIRKKARPGSGGIQEADGEHAASLIARKLGLDAPRVYRNDRESIYMDYVEHAQTADELIGHGGKRPKRVADAAGTDDGKKIGLLDLLTHNFDRNSGNWMLRDGHDGHVIPIDHGVAYTEMPDGDVVDLDNVVSDFADLYTQHDSNPLTREDVKEIRQRLENLRPDFERLGHGDWLDYSLRVLDALAPKAKGTRNLVAGVR